jgi:hypothetical protein
MDHSPDQIVTLATAFWGSKTLLAGVELGVFSALADEPLDAETLRARLGLAGRGARDFFDGLVALGLLTRDADGRYADTAETAYYLDRARPTYIGGLLEMLNGRLYRLWDGLADALRTGSPQSDAARDPSLFATLYADPARLRIFLQAMTGVSLPAVDALTRAFPWRDYGTFADVGTAEGALPAHVARAHPHLHGVGFDLPPVQPFFEEYVRGFGVDDRVRFVCGDFFRDPLPRADVVVLGHVLHDWGLEEKRDLLAKAYAALPSGGAVVLYEALIDDDRRHGVMGLLMSLNMLLETPAGFDYTAAEACAWMREAGFRDAGTRHLAGWDSMVVARK